MPLAAAIVPAVIGGAAKVYSANQQKKSANKALAAQQAAQEQQLQLQREQQDRAQGLYKPAVQGGYAAFDQLLTRMGVTGAGQPQIGPPAGGGAGKAPGGFAGTSPVEPAPYGAPQGGATGQPDYAAYGAANPDLQAEWQRIQQTGNADGFGNDPNAYYAHHYGTFGQGEGRELPTTGGAPQPAPQEPGAPQAPGPTAPGGPAYMNMARPDAPQAPEFQRPEAMQFENYGQGPQFAAPTWQDIEKDPGFQWEMKQGLDGVNASFAARGRVRSGGAAKALQKEGYGIAHSKGADYFNRALQGYNANRSAFQDNRNFGTGLTQYQQGRADNIFGDDRAYDTARWQDNRTYGDARFDAERNYATNRYDTQTQNLFNIAGMGQNAIAGTVGAGSAYANNAGNIYQNTANAQANAAQQRADANAGMAGAIGGAAGNIFANWGGGARSTGAPQTLGSAWGFQSAPTSQTFLNTPSSIRF